MSAPRLARTDLLIALEKELDATGYSYREKCGRKHGRILVDVDGRKEPIFVSGTPSDHRAIKNAVGHLRRKIREWRAESNDSIDPQLTEEEVMTESTSTAIDTIDVLGRQITKVEYKGQRVVTLRQIDEAHGKPEDAAYKQYKRHESRYIDGIDFFMLNASEFRNRFPELIGKRGGTDIRIFTERGYGKIVKGWNDDISWQLHDAMQDAYFMVKDVLSDNTQASVSNQDIGALVETMEEIATLTYRLDSKLIEVEGRINGLLSLDEWRTREYDALNWHLGQIRPLLANPQSGLDKKAMKELGGSFKRIMRNKENWQAVGLLPVPYGEEYEYRTADELCRLIIDADMIHRRLTSWVTNQILIPQARQEGWPQRQTEVRARSQKPIILFPLIPARNFIQSKKVRSSIIAKNDVLNRNDAIAASQVAMFPEAGAAK